MAKSPQSQDLPGMENRAIEPLQNAAVEYADIRDERIALNQRESQLKKRIKALMHEHKLDHYAFDGVDIELIPPDGEESVKVRVKKAKADEDDDDADTDTGDE